MAARLSLPLLVGSAIAQDSHAGHNHGGGGHDGHDHGGGSSAVYGTCGSHECAHEWAGKFEVSPTTPGHYYTWPFCKVNGAYADATMHMWFTEGTDLAAMGERATKEWEKHNNAPLSAENAALGTAGGSNVAGNVTYAYWQNTTLHADTVYVIVFDQAVECSVFNMHIAAHAGAGSREAAPLAGHAEDYLFFLQHFPTEFEGSMGHYLKAPGYANVEPEAQWTSIPPSPPAPAPVTMAPSPPNTLSRSEKWGYSFLASFISGTFIFFGAGVWYLMEVLGLDGETKILVRAMMRSFASGTLLVVVFVHLNMELGEAPIPKDWKPMCTIAAGGVFGLMSLLVPNHAGFWVAEEEAAKDGETDNEPSAEKPEGEQPVAVQTALDDFKKAEAAVIEAPKEQQKGTSLANAYLVTVGDFLCNFTDGVIITSAFWSCNAALGWEVMGAVICHELPGECADFSVMMSAGFNTCGALTSNSIAAFAAVLSSLIVSGAHESFGHDVNAYFICFGMGVLSVVAIASFQQFVANIDRSSWGFKHYAGVIFWLIAGAVILTSVLADFHVHCHPEVYVNMSDPASVAADPHAGHNH